MIRRLDAGQSIRVQHVLKIGLDRGRSYIRHGDNKAGTRGCRVRSGAVRPMGANKRSGSKKGVVLNGEVEGRAHSNAVSECTSERVVQNSARRTDVPAVSATATKPRLSSNRDADPIKPVRSEDTQREMTNLIIMPSVWLVESVAVEEPPMILLSCTTVPA